MSDPRLALFVVAGTTGPAITVCRECYEANKRYFAEGGTGTRKVPTLMAGGPEVQECEHLRDFVLGDRDAGGVGEGGL